MIYGLEGALNDIRLSHIYHIFHLASFWILYFWIESSLDDFVIWTDLDDGPLKILKRGRRWTDGKMNESSPYRPRVYFRENSMILVKYFWLGFFWKVYQRVSVECSSEEMFLDRKDKLWKSRFEIFCPKNFQNFRYFHWISLVWISPSLITFKLRLKSLRNLSYVSIAVIKL